MAHLLVLSQRHPISFPKSYKEPHLFVTISPWGQHWKAREARLPAQSCRVLEKIGPFISAPLSQRGFRLFQQKLLGFSWKSFQKKHTTIVDILVHLRLICSQALEQNRRACLLQTNLNYGRKHFTGLDSVSIFKCHFLLTTIWSGNEVCFMPLGQGHGWSVLFHIWL